MPYCQCTLLYGNCKAVMHVGCLPNCGELFANFWRPQRLVGMKSLNGAVDDDTILKSCKVMMTCVCAVPSFIKQPGYSKQSSRTVNDKHKKMKWKC